MGHGPRRARCWRQATAAKFKSLRQPAASSLATPNPGNASVSGSHDHVVLTLLLHGHLELHQLVWPTIWDYCKTNLQPKVNMNSYNSSGYTLALT